jgi:hypothetical protein
VSNKARKGNQKEGNKEESIEAEHHFGGKAVGGYRQVLADNAFVRAVFYSRHIEPLSGRIAC